jgi:hypothetical protein
MTILVEMPMDDYDTDEDSENVYHTVKNFVYFCMLSTAKRVSHLFFQLDLCPLWQLSFLETVIRWDHVWTAGML